MSNGCHPNCTEAAEKIQLQEQLAVAMQLIVAQQGEISRLKEEVKSGLHFVDWCRRNLFGRKSERVVIEEKDASQSRQLWLGEEFSREAEVVEASADETSASTTVSPRVRTIRRANPDGYEWDSRLRFPEDIQVTEVHVDPPEIAGLSSSEFEIIGYEVSHKLAQEKASYTVVRYKRPIVKLKEQAQIVTAPLPPAVTERSIFDLTLHAGMLVDKFVYHIPLSRQWERMQGAGLVLSRATLVNQTLRAIEQLEPVYQAQKESVLSSSVIAMDDTWMNVGSSQPGRMHRGFFFPIYGDKHEVVFPYAENRRDQQVADLLGNYKGVVVADGHGAYDTYAAQHAEVVRAQCWVHTRRNFFEIEGLKDLRAEALSQIGAMYQHEERIRELGLTGVDKTAYRQEQTAPIVSKFFEWLKEVCCARAFLPSDDFLKAARYALNRRSGLEVFLGNPEVPMDTNHLERALRVIPMGRRNYLFCWSEIGAARVGQIQSLLVTCKLHGIDPYTYLVDVFQRLDTHPQSKVEQLTPRLWKEHFGSNPLLSPLELARQRNLAMAA